MREEWEGIKRWLCTRGSGDNAKVSVGRLGDWRGWQRWQCWPADLVQLGEGLDWGGDVGSPQQPGHGVGAEVVEQGPGHEAAGKLVIGEQAAIVGFEKGTHGLDVAIEEAEPQGHPLVVAYPDPGVTEVDEAGDFPFPVQPGQQDVIGLQIAVNEGSRTTSVASEHVIQGVGEFFRNPGPDHLGLGELGQCVSSAPVYESVPRFPGVQAFERSDVGVVQGPDDQAHLAADSQVVSARDLRPDRGQRVPRAGLQYQVVPGDPVAVRAGRDDGWDRHSMVLTQELDQPGFDFVLGPEWAVDLENEAAVQEEDSVGVGAGSMDGPVADSVGVADGVDYRSPEALVVEKRRPG